MPRYLIERDVSGWTADEIDVAGLRAKMCAPWFVGLDWIISYHDAARQLLFCIYDANSEDDIRAHARFAGLPAGAVRAVQEIHPEDIDGDDVTANSEAPPTSAPA